MLQFHMLRPTSGRFPPEFTTVIMLLLSLRSIGTKCLKKPELNLKLLSPGSSISAKQARAEMQRQAVEATDYLMP